jgi:hypothetical protein
MRSGGRGDAAALARPRSQMAAGDVLGSATAMPRPTCYESPPASAAGRRRTSSCPATFAYARSRMALSRRDRIRLKTQIIEALESDDWTWARTNVLMHEFGLEALHDPYDGTTVGDLIADLSDSLLVEMYAVVMDVETDEVEDTLAAGTDDGNWKRGYVRLFLSHSARYKAFAGDVARELAVVGIHGFVAHDTMEYTKPWQLQIEKALRTMQAFAALAHPEFNDSAWCQEEVGWALGRRVPHYVVRMGADPAGFVGRDQWPSCADQDAKQVAQVIAAWVIGDPELGPDVFDGLLQALASSGNYFDAEATAERIAALGSLSDEQFTRIGEVWWTNDQLYGGYLPSKVMERFYWANNRAWPPLRPAPPADPDPF